MNKHKHGFRLVILKELLKRPVSFAKRRFEYLDVGIKSVQRPLDNRNEDPVRSTIGNNAK